MKIIVAGDPKLATTRTFKCSVCGCVFEAIEDEYRDLGEYYLCNCPTCGHRVYIKNENDKSWKE